MRSNLGSRIAYEDSQEFTFFSKIESFKFDKYYSCAIIDK